MKTCGQDFDWFWKAYPKKRSKGDARKAWLQTKDLRPEIREILATIKAFKDNPNEWNDPQYIPHPATWLRAEGWADVIEVVESTNKTLEAMRQMVKEGRLA